MINKETKQLRPPLLLISHGDLKEKQSFYNVLENRYHKTSVPVLQNKHVVSSSHGWLVLVDPEQWYNCCLFNPGSMETIQLPSLDESHLYNRCVLSKPPTEPDCQILFNSSCMSEQSFCTIGDEFFVKQCLEDQENQDYSSLMAIASFKGKIYGVTKPGYKFVTIHFKSTNLEFRPILSMAEEPCRIPQPSQKWVTWHEDCLIESPCGGDLLFVVKMYSGSYLTNHGLEFRVYQGDVNGTEWAEVDNIGERTIFVGDQGSGFCCYSTCYTGFIKPNSIYYTDQRGTSLYVYDLADGGTTELWTCPAGQYRSNTFWVERNDVLRQLTN